MDFKEFTEQALRTETVPTQDVQADVTAMRLALTQVAASCRIVDLYKRKVIYGKDIDSKKLTNELATIFNTNTDLAVHDELAEELPLEFFRFVHAVMGMATEVGEIVETLLQCLEDGKVTEAQLLNLQEEAGDYDWYKALLFDHFGFSETESRKIVIAKLVKRYGEKFSAEKALNRDIDAEVAAMKEATK